MREGFTPLLVVTHWQFLIAGGKKQFDHYGPQKYCNHENMHA